MRLLGSLFNFLLGALVGALIGALITALLAPQSGQEFKVRVRERIDEGRAARDRAEAETAAELTERFRRKVNNPNALKEL
jgi:gas vesicle protein